MNPHMMAAEKISHSCVNHRNWQNAITEAFPVLSMMSPGEVLAITGPSRVGKTRLIGELRRLLTGDDHALATGEMPVVQVSATNSSTHGSFGTKAFAKRALTAIAHPIYGLSGGNDPTQDFKRQQLMRRTSEDDLRDAFELGLQSRKTKYLIIDEAQHILHVPGGIDNAAAILDSWKNLAQDNQLMLVLVGAYPILEAINLSAHMLGRKHLVHFPRYRATQEDFVPFAQILATYTEYVRLEPGVTSLVDWAELLHQGSLGCIGLVNKWLRTALARATARDAKYLEEKHLIETFQPADELDVISHEIFYGEDALAPPAPGETVQTTPAPTATSSKHPRKSKPYQKKPRRYSVGSR